MTTPETTADLDEARARIAELQRERDAARLDVVYWKERHEARGEILGSVISERAEARRELRAIRWLQKTRPTAFELLGPRDDGLVGVYADCTVHLTYSGAAEALCWKDDDG